MTTERDRSRDFQKLIPHGMRRDFGNRTHFNHYVNRELVPLDGAAVELQKQAWELAYNTWFHHLAALPYVERLAVIDDLLSLPTAGDRLAAVVGGLPEHLRRLTQPLAFQVAVQRHLVTVGNETNPIDVAAEMDMSLPDVVTTTFEHRQHLQALEAKAARVRAVIAAVAGNGPEAIGNGMRDLFDEWRKAPLVKTGTAPEITHKHKASVERFLTVCNGGSDMPVRSITREHIKRFFEMNNAELPDKPAARLKHRDHIKALLSLAVRQGWRENNPMDGVPFTAPPRKATDGDDEEGKKPFTPAQLTAIHAAAATAWAGKPDLLLALRLLTFDGLRSNEACQLRVTDIEEHAGHWCIRVRKGPGQSVKNKSSRRIVPVHPEVRAEVLARVEAGGEWLFPSFPHHNPKKHNAAFLAAFNGRQLDDGTYVGLLRGTCGIVDPDLTAHSLRHSFKDACRRARVEGETIKEMMGHGKGCAHEEYGAEMPELMADAIGDVQPLVPGMKPRAAITGRNSGRDTLTV